MCRAPGGVWVTGIHLSRCHPERREVALRPNGAEGPAVCLRQSGARVGNCRVPHSFLSLE